METRARLATVAALIAAFAVPCAFATVYKLVDKRGNVTYSNEPAPKGFEGEVTIVDTNAPLVMPGDVPAATPLPPAAPQPRAVRAAPRNPNVAAARAQALAARRAYEDARNNPGEGDWISHAPLPSGATRGPSPEYLERLARLEKEAQDAETRLNQLEGRAR